MYGAEIPSWQIRFAVLLILELSRINHDQKYQCYGIKQDIKTGIEFTDIKL